MSTPLPRFFSLRTLGFALVAALVVVVVNGILARRSGSAVNAAEPAARRMAPDFTVTTLDGKPWALSEQKGQVILINFFATWCPPCRAEMPDLVSIANDYDAKGVVTLGLSLDEGGAAIVQPFVQRYDVAYPIALAEPGSAITEGVSAIPVTMIVDRSGRVARKYVGAISPEKVRSDLDQVLGEAPANSPSL